MRPDPRYELALASQVPHTQTEHPDTSAVAVTLLLCISIYEWHLCCFPVLSPVIIDVVLEASLKAKPWTNFYGLGFGTYG